MASLYAAERWKRLRRSQIHWRRLAGREKLISDLLVLRSGVVEAVAAAVGAPVEEGALARMADPH